MKPGRTIRSRFQAAIAEPLESRMLLSGEDWGFDFPGETSPTWRMPNYAVGKSPRSVAVADVTGDGMMDVLTADPGDHSVSMLRNLGDGKFAARVSLAGGTAPSCVTAADVDSDGKTDVIWADEAASRIVVVRNFGNGLFASQPPYVVGSFPKSVIPVDVDGDGKVDLVSANYYSNTVSVLRNLGDGTFAPQVTHAVGSSPTSVVAADVNGDGNMDLVTANSDAKTISILRNVGSGIFAPQVTCALGSNPASITAADVSGDGRPDLIATNPSSGTVSVLRNLGNGSFASPVTYAVGYGAGAWPQSAVASDVDGDGKLDLITANCNDQTTSVLRNLGNGTFGPPANYAVDVVLEGGSATCVAAADVTGDGRIDLVTATVGQYTGTVWVLPNLGDGTFAIQAAFATGSEPRGLATADVNGDGSMDLLTVHATSNTVSVLRNFGNGTFAAPVSYAVGRSPGSITAADMTNDGKVDLIAANYSDATVSVLRNLGDGTFAPQVSYSVPRSPLSVTAADMTNDGKADLVVVTDGGGVAVLRNLGNGTFAPYVTYPTGVGPQLAVVADLDRDGSPDLVTANQWMGTISVLRNLGDGTFAPQVPYDVGAGPTSVAAADLNGDGIIDVVTANYDDITHASTVSVLLNRGVGTFATRISYAVRGMPLHVIAADVNGDGRPDVMTANKNDDTVSVLRNLGNGQFAAEVAFAVGTFPSCIAAADLNGDGRLDLATANNHAIGSVSVLRNLGPWPAPLVVSGTSGDDQIYVKNEVGILKWWIVPAGVPMPNPATDTPTGTKPLSEITTLTVQGGNGNDTIILDLSGGVLSATVGGGVSVDGGLGTDCLLIKGSVGAVVSASSIALGTERTISIAAIEKVGFADGAMSVATWPQGMGMVAAGTASMTLTQPLTMPSLEISDTAKVTLSPGAYNVLITRGLTISQAASLDLTDNGLIIQAASPADRDAFLVKLSALIGAARHDGAWDQAGLTSSTAKTDATELSGIAIMANADAAGAPIYYDGAWQHHHTDANSVLVKYTFNGDADLNGSLDGSDYFFIDKGYLSRNLPNPPTGYRNGDFNYDGAIDGSDYFLIDKAFLSTRSLAPAAMFQTPQRPPIDRSPLAAHQSPAAAASRPRRATRRPSCVFGRKNDNQIP